MITSNGLDLYIPNGDIGNATFAFSGNLKPSVGSTVQLTVADNSSVVISKNATVSSDYKAVYSFIGSDTENLSAGKRYRYSLRIVQTDGYDSPICTGHIHILEVVTRG